MRTTLPNSFSRKVFLASGGKPSTDFGSDFKCFSLYRGVVHLDAEHQRRIVVFRQDWYVRPITFPLTSFMGQDPSFLVGFLHILQLNTAEDIVYNLWSYSKLGLLPHNSTASNIRSNHKQGNDKIKLFALFNRHITKIIVGLQSHNNPKTSLDTLILDWISEQSRITRNLTAHEMIFSNNSRTGHNLMKV